MSNYIIILKKKNKIYIFETNELNNKKYIIENNINTFFKKSDIIFVCYKNKFFNKLSNIKTNKKKIIIDLWNYINTKNKKVIVKKIGVN